MKALTAVLAVLAGIASSQARIITVDDDGPADFNNIQAAIDDANHGDTVEIRPGTYTGAGNRDIDFKGKAITVRSTNPNDWGVVAATVIDCQGSEADPHRGFKFNSGEDANSVLAGLSITSGYGPRDVIAGNDRAFVGGGIYCAASSPTISECIISHNRAPNGGGICCCIGAAPRIRNCRVRDNSGFGGGGIYCTDSSVEVVNCIVRNNVAYTSGNLRGRGAGIVCEFSSPIIKNCTFYGNHASGSGGAIWTYGSPESISNCIIWGNLPGEIRGSATVSFSNVRGGYSGTGNINTDPVFADPDNGDYALKSQAGRYDPNGQAWVLDDVTSPCIDAGDPMSPIGLEPFPNGGRVNMGAYGGTAEASKSYFGEPPCETIIAGDINGDCIVDFRDFWLMALHWLEEY